MSTPLELRTMAAVLRQGAPLDRLSLMLLATALLLVAWYAGTGAVLAAALCAGSALAGLLQRYWAARVGLDVDLLEAVLAEAEPARAGADLDAVLHRLGLLRTLPPPRDWLARWQGMRRLLRRQLIALAAQWLALLLALCTAQFA
ncbi:MULTISPECIES: hypothetical protein [Xanthomonas]|uniref:hypothetical protein n=1 Tax=Xanthomonas TaxID=338 RepID=UPI0022587E61|nr:MULTISPECIES: hypothetical protein [Xanthomonas]MCW0389478.1 hypothetical protein [Xanthomonas sacchari]MDY4282729.1 hypothetical protein [Xanthomonas sp. LF06-19]MDY4297413.1 hypothetical protein [Xanthomonas sp. LF02-5]MDY4359207.1 hypothetical protein [Xanthomonas sp. LF04-12]